VTLSAVQHFVFFIYTKFKKMSFYQRILWSDDCSFSNNGIFNRHNDRCLAQENPHVMVVNNFQRRFSVNVWCGILHNRLVGPIFIDGNLDQYKCNTILREGVENFLDVLPLNEFRRVIFQQDGATPHNAILNRELLRRRFGDSWIGTYGPIPWSARAVDITPMDTFFWGYFQDQVYAPPPENEAQLRDNIIEAACRILPAEMLSSATYGVSQRCRQCLAQNGEQFEHRL
jgi:hypothetical protein